MTLKQLLGTISKREWRFVIILIIAVIIITTAPYVFAYYNAPQGYFYDGLHSLTPGDILVYFSYINQVKEGNWLLQDYFTSEPQTGGILNIFWLGVGLLALIFNLTPFVAFQLARVLLIPVLLAMAYIFISYFFAEKTQRKLAMIFLCFSSGVGAYFALYYEKVFLNSLIGEIYKWPIDMWMPESNIFLTLYHNSHLIFSWTCMLAFFLLILLAWDNNKYRYSLGAGLVGLIWFNFHPYYFPYVFAILFVYGLIRLYKRKQIFYIYHYLVALALCLPSVLYHYYKMKTDLVIGVRASQNVTLTSPLIFNVWGFGFLLFLGVIGIYYLIKNKELYQNDKYLFLVTWLISGGILIYSPIAFQRRFIEGLQFPMIILTVIALLNLSAFLKNRGGRIHRFIDGNYYFLTLLFLIFFGFSTIFNLVRDVDYFKNRYYKFYLPNEYKDAVSWLGNNEKGVILSQNFSSWLIPGLANLTVYMAHDHETIYSKRKKQEVDTFFADSLSHDEAVKFLNDNRIRYILYTNVERYYFLYDPEVQDYLERVWQQGQIEIYKVK